MSSFVMGMKTMLRATHVGDGLLGLLLYVSGLLKSLLDLRVKLCYIRLQLLLSVEETGVLIRV